MFKNTSRFAIPVLLIVLTFSDPAHANVLYQPT